MKNRKTEPLPVKGGVTKTPPAEVPADSRKEPKAAGAPAKGKG